MEANKNEVTENPNNDIDTIDDINVLTDIYIKEAKEANELSKKLELITQRFTLIRDKITSLRHMQDDKSEDKDELSDNEIVEKTKKEKKESTGLRLFLFLPILTHKHKVNKRQTLST
jgi:hypothetical protein